MATSAEQFSWAEGELLVWTGTAAAHTVTFASEGRANMVYGWSNIGPMFDGSYVDVKTGQRADVSVAAAYTYDTTIQKIAASATAVHLKINYSGINGSAGFVYHSGRIDSLSTDGIEGGLVNMRLAYHANVWSAY